MFDLRSAHVAGGRTRAHRACLGLLAAVLMLIVVVGAGSARANGIFSTSGADPAAIRSLGFDYGMTSGYRENLDRFHATGLKAMVWLGGYSQDTCSFNWTDVKIRQRIAEIKGHPAIYAYFIDDEPHAGPECSNTPNQVRARNALVKSLDPAITTVITENRTASFAALAGTADVMGLVIYPCNHTIGGCNWNRIPDRVAAAEAAGVTRYWGVTQTAGDEYYKRPTPTELRQIIAQWNATRAEQDFAYTWDCCGTPLDGLNAAPELWDTWKAENGSAAPSFPPVPEPVPVPPTTSSPLTIRAPVESAEITGVFRLDVRAGSSVRRVDYLVDGQRTVYDDSATDFSEEWDSRTVAPGRHGLVARATLADGSTRDSAPVSFTVR